MDRTPYLDQLRPADVAVMDAEDARAYIEQRMREAAPQYPPHRTQRGRILLELDGKVCEALLLSTGRHCRSFGIEVDGCVIGVMGIDRAFSTVISPAVRRPHSIKHCLP